MAWLFSRSNETFSVAPADEPDEDGSPNGGLTHGPWNNYNCGDPDCICNNCDESDAPLPTPHRALNPERPSYKTSYS